MVVCSSVGRASKRERSRVRVPPYHFNRVESLVADGSKVVTKIQIEYERNSLQEIDKSALAMVRGY